MLSDEDIREAIKNRKQDPEQGLMIYPFDENSLTPVGYDLRVGEEGYSWNKKCIIDIKKNGEIEIDPQDTVVIKTLESLSLSKQISGSIHAIVSKIVKKGLSDISTTIDPGYSGILLISVRNNRSRPTILKFKEPFCTACFYNVTLAAKKERGTSNSRLDLWEQLLEKADEEKKRIELEEKEKKLKEKRLLVFIISSILIIEAVLFVKNPQLVIPATSIITLIAQIIIFYITSLQSKSKV